MEHIHNVNSSTRKRQPSGGTNTTPKAKRGRPKQSSIMTRYPSLMDVDDDEVTINRNYTKLQREVAEDRPKKDVVLRLARDIFPMRRGHTG